jgi:hypothetical protein
MQYFDEFECFGLWIHVDGDTVKAFNNYGQEIPLTDEKIEEIMFLRDEQKQHDARDTLGDAFFSYAKEERE